MVRGLLLRAVAHHRGTSIAVLLTAVLAVAAAACGPLWGRAAEESLVRDALAAGEVRGTGYTVTVAANTVEGLDLDLRRPPLTALEDAELGADLGGGLGALLDAPRRQLVSTRRLEVSEAPGPEVDPEEPTAGLGRLAWREGACEHLVLASGRCPSAASEVLLSDRTAQTLGVGTGSVVRLAELSVEPPPAGQDDPFPTDYEVSGTYGSAAVDPGDRYWFGSELFDFSPAAVAGGDPLPARLDAVLATQELLVSLQRVGLEASAERALRPGALPLRQVDAAVTALDAAALDGDATGAGAEHEAPLAGTLRAVADERSQVRTAALLVSAQVVLLGWYVLLGVVAVSVTAREPEVALAKLRGLPPARAARLALGPPLLLVAVAVPLGLGLAWLVAARLGAAVLAPGTPVALSATAAGAAGVAALGAVAAAVLASWRALRAPVADQLRRSGGVAERRQDRTVVVAVVSVAAAAVSLVGALGVRASGSTVALLMPVLVGLAAGLVAARVLAWVAGRAVGWSRLARLPRFLAVRQLARRPGTTRSTALVTATVTFVGFAAAAWVVAREQRATEARLAVGAAQVVSVDPVPPTQLLDVVRSVDPGGRAAMAAVEVAGERDSGVARVLAVDTTRFDAVAAGESRQALSAATGAELGADDGATTLEVTGTRWEVDLELDQVETSLGLALVGAAVTPAGDPVPIAFGAVQEGRSRVTADVPDCAAGCRVTTLRLVRRPGQIGGFVAVLRLHSLSVDGVVVDRFSREDWRPTRIDDTLPSSSETLTIDEAPDGLLARMGPSPSVSPGIARRDVPAVLPGVLGAATPVDYVGVDALVVGASLGDTAPNLRVVERAAALPRLGREGLLVDLAVVERFAPARRTSLQAQVWLSEEAPAGTLDALRSAGLVVRDVETVAQRRAELDAGGTALALLLLLVAAAVVLLTGLAGVATSLAAQARRRAFEAAALRAVAVPERDLRRAAAWELGLLLVPALLLGTACAGGALVLATDLLPSLTGATGTGAALPGPLRVWGSVVAASALAGACLAVLAALSGRGGGGRRGAQRLREGQA